MVFQRVYYMKSTIYIGSLSCLKPSLKILLEESLMWFEWLKGLGFIQRCIQNRFSHISSSTLYSCNKMTMTQMALNSQLLIDQILTNDVQVLILCLSYFVTAVLRIWILQLFPIYLGLLWCGYTDRRHTRKQRSFAQTRHSLWFA